MTQYSLIPSFDHAVADAAIMHPTAAELQAQMNADEAAEAASFTPPISPSDLPRATYAPTPIRKARKPRRQPVNVADSTPF